MARAKQYYFTVPFEDAESLKAWFESMQKLGIFKEGWTWGHYDRAADTTRRREYILRGSRPSNVEKGETSDLIRRDERISERRLDSRGNYPSE